LYGIAIILILLFHCAGTHVNHYGPLGADSFLFVAISSFEKYVGSVGVELFVFLSGMSMYYSYTRNSRLLSFYSKRYQRILIPYIYIGGAFWIIKDVLVLREGWIRAAYDFLFITFFTEGVRTIWFILFLMAAYAILPAVYQAIFSRKEASVIAFTVITLVFLGLPILLFFTYRGLFNNIEIALTRFPLFVIGVFSGKYIKDGARVPRLCIVALVAAAISLKYYDAFHDTAQYTNRYIAAIFGM